MTQYTLYCFAQSGNAYRAALMLNLVGAEWSPRFVDFFNGETRTPDYRAAINEMGEAPVLEFDGTRLSQSGVILDYLACETGKYGWSDEQERREILRWLLYDNQKVNGQLGPYRFLTYFMGQKNAVTDFLKDRIDMSLAILDKHLSDKDWIVGDKPTIADVSMSGYLHYDPAELGYDLAVSHPGIAAWLSRVRALPGWAHPYDLMPGHPLPEKG